jgi:hypothetical protein
VLADGVTPPDRKFEVRVMTSSYPDGERSASDPDSYTYYAELLVAVDGQSLPKPRLALDDPRPGLRPDRDLPARFDDTRT